MVERYVCNKIRLLIFKNNNLFSRVKKTSIAVALIRGPGHGIIRVNGIPLDLVQPELLKIKVFEPLLLIGEEKFGDFDIRIRVKGGGKISQIYAIRQAIAKGFILYLEKYVGEIQKNEIKRQLLEYCKLDTMAMVIIAHHWGLK